MSFLAKFPGPCDDCDTRIRPNDEIDYNSSGAVVHVICPDTDVRPADRVCPDCFTELPVAGVCGVCE